MLHVRYAGRSYDFADRQVDVKAAFSDDEIKNRVAGELDLSVDQLEGYVIDRSPTGDVIVRPEAVYG